MLFCFALRRTNSSPSGTACRRPATSTCCTHICLAETTTSTVRQSRRTQHPLPVDHPLSVLRRRPRQEPPPQAQHPHCDAPRDHDVRYRAGTPCAFRTDTHTHTHTHRAMMTMDPSARMSRRNEGHTEPQQSPKSKLQHCLPLHTHCNSPVPVRARDDNLSTSRRSSLALTRPWRSASTG